MLKDLVKQSYIQIDVEASDWKEAIKKSANPMVEDKTVNIAYVESIINTVKEFGPYFVITKGIALPHASSENNVNQNAMTITVLKDSVSFGHEFNDPVKKIFVLAVKNSTDHIDSLSELVELLSDEKFQKKLDESRNPNEIFEYLNNEWGVDKNA